MKPEIEDSVRWILMNARLAIRSAIGTLQYNCDTKIITVPFSGSAPGPVRIHGRVYPAGQSPPAAPDLADTLLDTEVWDPTVPNGSVPLHHPMWPTGAGLTVAAWLETREFERSTLPKDCLMSGSGSGAFGVAVVPPFEIGPRSYALDVEPGPQADKGGLAVLRPGILLTSCNGGPWTADERGAKFRLTVDTGQDGVLRGWLTVEVPNEAAWTFVGTPWIMNGSNILRRISESPAGFETVILKAQ